MAPKRKISCSCIRHDEYFGGKVDLYNRVHRVDTRKIKVDIIKTLIGCLTEQFFFAKLRRLCRTKFNAWQIKKKLNGTKYVQYKFKNIFHNK